MTKPIEGWMFCVDGVPYVCREPMGAAGDCIKMVVNEPNELAMQNFRPVRITFTDEADVMQKRLEGETPSREVSRNDPNCCAESSTHEAVRKAKDLIEDGVEDNEFNRSLIKTYEYIESLAPELNGYIELEEGQKIENALKKERERILRAVSTSWPSGYSQMKSIIFGEEK